MNVYPKLGKTKVGYFYISNSMHKSLEQTFNKINYNEYGCPSVGGLSNRLFKLNSLASLIVKFGVKDNEPYYTYEIDTKIHNPTELMHDFVNDKLQVRLSNTGNCVLQFTTPIVFVTDDKELEFTTVMPNMKTENCTYIHGGFKPYYWVRSFNSSWTLKDISKPGKLYFDINNPFISVVFNKSVELEYMEVTEKIKNYFDQSFRVNGIRKNLNQIYNNAKSRRPKRLLDK